MSYYNYGKVNMLRLILMISFVISTSSFAKNAEMYPSDDCVSCEQALRGDPSKGSELAYVRKIASIARPDFELLGMKACTRPRGGILSSGETPAQGIKTVVVNFMKEYHFTTSPNPSTPEILTFLNENKNKITCRGINWVAYMISEGFANIVFDDLVSEELYDDNVLFDFNAVSRAYNPLTKKYELMTNLDYIEKVAFNTGSIVGDSNTRSDFNNMKDAMIDDYGAKRFNDLPASERENYNLMISRK